MFQVIFLETQLTDAVLRRKSNVKPELEVVPHQRPSSSSNFDPVNDMSPAMAYLPSKKFFNDPVLPAHPGNGDKFV